MWETLFKKIFPPTLTLTSILKIIVVNIFYFRFVAKHIKIFTHVRIFINILMYVQYCTLLQMNLCTYLHMQNTNILPYEFKLKYPLLNYPVGNVNSENILIHSWNY